MVVIVIEGIRATGENTVEASLVADFVMALRDSLRDETDQLYSDDSRFFERGVFIVSPHRAQIRAIRRELNRRRKWDAPPFVDTVDKMQGQGADAVIISYGVSDPEDAMEKLARALGVDCRAFHLEETGQAEPAPAKKNRKRG